MVWISHQNPKGIRSPGKPDHTLRTLLLVIVGTPITMMAAYGKFGLAMQPIGILLSVPLLFASISVVMGAPWIGLMWLGAYVSHLCRAKRDRKSTESISGSEQQ